VRSLCINMQIDYDDTLVAYGCGSKIIVDSDLRKFKVSVMWSMEKNVVQSVSLNSCDKGEFISSLATKNTKNVIDDKCLFPSEIYCYNSLSCKDGNVFCDSPLKIEHENCNDMIFSLRNVKMSKYFYNHLFL